MLLTARATSRAERAWLREALGEDTTRVDTACTATIHCTRTRELTPRRYPMLASWYDDQGPAAEVLHVGELPDPVPGPGEVRVRVTVSGVNPGDTKKRRGWLGSAMPYPRVIPHSDAAGVIDAVGDGVDARRVGQRVWVYGAQSYRPFGTAAQYTVVPDHRPSPCPTTSATSSARASASPASPRTAPCSPTARSTARRSWSTACSAGSARWPPSSPTGPAPP